MEGLTSAEAAARLARDGRNVMPGTPRIGRGRVVARAFLDPMVGLLVVAAITYVALHDPLDATIAILAIVPVVGVGLVLETRTDRALRALRELGATRALVMRDGVEQLLSAEVVVVGDCVRCIEGDVAPADIRVAGVTHAFVDRSLLTGESVPEPVGEAAIVAAGSVIVAGQLDGEVVATGRQTEIGRIGGLLRPASVRRSPLEQRARRWVILLSIAAVGVGLLVVGIQLGYGEPFGLALIAGLTLAIATVPEELPVLLATYRAIGAVQLTRRHALVRNLGALEQLGVTSVICTDKTGTLTEGRVEVACIVDRDGVVHLVRDPLPEGAREVLASAMAACEAQAFDPLDRAILAAGDRVGVAGSDGEAELIEDYEFTPHLRRATHVWRTDATYRVVAKGALDGFMERCVDDRDRLARFEAIERDLAQEGMRVIAVADARVAVAPGNRDEADRAVRVHGLIGLHDPVRADVPEAIARCQDAGIRVVMVTGDVGETAHAVAHAVGLAHPDGTALTGADFAEAPRGEQARLVEERSLVARVRPEQKMAMVEALQDAGAVVAMTGDGVNDAPALRQADVGVAMGARGTQVAREAADVVLLDDDFATIVAGVEGGRAVMYRLGRALSYLVGFHVPIVVLALVVPLFDVPLLLLPAELLLLQLIVHPMVALVFQGDPVPSALMRVPPQQRIVLLPGREIVRALVLGVVLSVLAGAWYVVGDAVVGAGAGARTAGFVALVAGQFALVLACRDPQRSAWRVRPFWTRVVTIAMVVTTLGLLAIVYVEPLAHVLRLRALPAWVFLGAVVSGVVAAFLLEPQRSRSTRHRAG